MFKKRKHISSSHGNKFGNPWSKAVNFKNGWGKRIVWIQPQEKKSGSNRLLKTCLNCNAMDGIKSSSRRHQSSLFKRNLNFSLQLLMAIS